MAALYLMVGLPGSGKTTRAKQIEAEEKALRLTPDEWQLYLFGNDFHNDKERDQEHDDRHTRIENLMWQVAERALQLGTNVVLDFGCWAKEERETFREKAHAVGAEFHLIYMACDIDELWRRIQRRNQEAGTEVFPITQESLIEWSHFFQPPTEEEIARH